MKKTWMVVLIVLIFSCKDGDDAQAENCTELATVVDLSSLDMCGFVFELENGERLEPYRQAYCGTPPLPKEVLEDPLYGFEFVNGHRVMIGYEEASGVSSCMAGKLVTITCIKDLAAAVVEY
jgi:hypothetical protein